jgi:hypothetical protein
MQNLSGLAIKKRPLTYLLLKILFLGIIPFCLTFFLYEIFLFACLFCYLLVMLLLTIILLIFTKKSLWQGCSGAQIELQKVSVKNKKFILIPLLTALSLIVFQFIRQACHPNGIIHNKSIAIPVSIPEKAYYVKNIRQYKQDPVDYVMQLFDNYDIVFFCERLHPEYTQWEFFSEIILNDTFAKKVKNVFTEIGIAEKQETLDSYMDTRFSTEEDLQRETARIVRDGGSWPLWNNTNIYDFVLNLHRFNETKDRTDRINLFFTDKQTNWDEIKNPAQWDSMRINNRDSIMAHTVLNRYETLQPNKCLIIVNTRHAWNYGENEAACIFKKYPGKMAVVWINGTTQMAFPAINGTLDEAALEITDSIWAIDFNQCPLGNTVFDLMLLKYDKCAYKDLFAGMIYCKHPSEWEIVNNYPFILDDYKDTLLKRSALVGEKYFQQEKENVETGYYDEIEKQKYPFLILFNMGFLGMHCIILLFLCLDLLILFFNKKIRPR